MDQFARGKTSKKVALFGNIGEFFSISAPYMLELDFIEKLEYVAEELRNPSAHDIGMTQHSSTEARRVVGDLLDKMTRMRLVLR